MCDAFAFKERSMSSIIPCRMYIYGARFDIFLNLKNRMYLLWCFSANKTFLQSELLLAHWLADDYSTAHMQLCLIHWCTCK